MLYKTNEIIAVILSGGLSRRMANQDKALLQLNSKPLFEYVLDNITSQCETVIINSNREDNLFEHYQLPIIKDSLDGFLGPLAGILTAMEWVKENSPQTLWIVSVPVDTPFLPNNLVSQLYQSTQENKSLLACPVSNGRTHPVIGLWSIALIDDLRTALKDEGLRKIDKWTARYNISQQIFNYENIDPFFNINCDDDLVEAEKLLNKFV
ncbi:MAG: molybdenum cofactor guanylyltransferase MobA [Cycloclasticus sp. symbiont of Bathymodiolus heckerae]|nr:MAG: molybdenum cofactor guanylyltransferase MobA [Cycloclasticus sp. symbiont of Bathymodiolus heckerae]